MIIEYYYGMANPVEFNNVLSVKFRESDRNFDNMTLAFRLPGSSNVYRVRPKPFKLSLRKPEFRPKKLIFPFLIFAVFPPLLSCR